MRLRIGTTERPFLTPNVDTLKGPSVGSNAPTLRLAYRWLPPQKPPSCRFTPSEGFESGHLWRLRRHQNRFFFEFATPHHGTDAYRIAYVDLAAGEGCVWVRKETCPRNVVTPHEYPLDELLFAQLLPPGRIGGSCLRC